VNHKLAFYNKTAHGCALGWLGPVGLPRGCLGVWRLSQLPDGHRTNGMVPGQVRLTETSRWELGTWPARVLEFLKQI